MPSNDFKEAVNEYVAALKKAKKSIDVGHLPDPGKMNTEEGLSLNQAFSYIEAAVALIEKAEDNLKIVVGSKGRKSK